jgi:hypothetical protein
MPGKYIDVVTVYQCGELPDGTAIMCTRFGWDKIPFLEPEFFDAEIHQRWDGKRSEATAFTSHWKDLSWQWSKLA